MSRFIEVAKQSQIPEGGTIGVEIEGKRLALAKLKGEVYNGIAYASYNVPTGWAGMQPIRGLMRLLADASP